MQVTLDLSDEQVGAIQAAFSPSRFATPQETVEALLPLMVSAWLDWMSGAKRYSSLTEQYTDWLEQVYARLLPPGEAPSATRLYNSFNIPYGQAQYIARVLNNKALTQWRKWAVDNLKSMFLKRRDEIYAWIKANDGEQNAGFLMDNVTYVEFKLLFEQLYRQLPGQIELYKYTSAGNLYKVLITASTFARLCEALGIQP